MVRPAFPLVKVDTTPFASGQDGQHRLLKINYYFVHLCLYVCPCFKCPPCSSALMVVICGNRLTCSFVILSCALYGKEEIQPPKPDYKETAIQRKVLHTAVTVCEEGFKFGSQCCSCRIGFSYSTLIFTNPIKSTCSGRFTTFKQLRWLSAPQGLLEALLLRPVCSRVSPSVALQSRNA